MARLGGLPSWPFAAAAAASLPTIVERCRFLVAEAQLGRPGGATSVDPHCQPVSDQSLRAVSAGSPFRASAPGHVPEDCRSTPANRGPGARLEILGR